MNLESEPDAVAHRFARRTDPERYSMLQPDVWHSVQERQREMLKLFLRLGHQDLGVLRLLEVGCGTGGNLLEFLRLGFSPEHLQGIELLPDRTALARECLPQTLTVHAGDALQLALGDGAVDIVFVSTVFSSLLDPAYQARLARRMWQWDDFQFNNPRNADVRGVPLARLRELFPEGQLQARRVTLAPPLARAAVRLHPSLYTVFNSLPLFRTHVLAWIGKR
jgi:SAM-dependent methyltransferase